LGKFNQAAIVTRMEWGKLPGMDVGLWDWIREPAARTHGRPGSFGGQTVRLRSMAGEEEEDWTHGTRIMLEKRKDFTSNEWRFTPFSGSAMAQGDFRGIISSHWDGAHYTQA
jgi:hypothetical protein